MDVSQKDFLPTQSQEDQDLESTVIAVFKQAEYPSGSHSHPNLTKSHSIQRNHNMQYETKKKVAQLLLIIIRNLRNTRRVREPHRHRRRSVVEMRCRGQRFGLFRGREGAAEENSFCVGWNIYVISPGTDLSAFWLLTWGMDVDVDRGLTYQDETLLGC